MNPSETESNNSSGFSKRVLVDLSVADSNKWRRIKEHLLTPEASTKPPWNDDEIRRPRRQQQRRLNAKEVSEVVTAYRSGETVYTLAERYGCHRNTISRILKSNGVKLANTPTAQATVDEIVRLYKAGLPMTQVSREVGVSAKTVFNYLRASGIRTRDSHGRERGAQLDQAPYPRVTTAASSRRS